ncbi:MAG TPA: CHASE4 domain-containing protein, partial [Chthoniobacterales bacterium]|nr:CHASE4 domain-containing protein [Chthoniobacterales bacterium]
MKVQTKIILLLVAVTAIFAGGVWFLRLAERQNVRRIAEERFTERHRSFEDFLEHHGEPLKTMVLDYTAWDQMVEATVKGDDAWFEENVGDAALDSFHTNAVWIYGKDGKRVHRTNNLGSDGLDEVPVPREAIAQLFAQAPLAHFFAETPLGLMEICGGTIHPSKDFERTTPAEGFFFAGRLWSQPVLDEMSMFTGNKVSLAPPTRSGENLNDEKDGVIAFSRPLHGWDGRPLADLVVRNESPVVRELNRASERLLFSVVLFSLALLLILAFALMRWVSRPLRRAMESLKRNDPKP